MTAKIYFLSKENFYNYFHYLGDDIVLSELNTRMDMMAR